MYCFQQLAHLGKSGIKLLERQTWTALLTLHPATIDAPQCIYIFLFLFTQGYLFIYSLIVIYYYLAVAVNVHSNLSL